MHEAGHASDHRHHDDRQCIYTDCPVCLEVAHVNPRHQRDDALLEFDGGSFRARSQIGVERGMVRGFTRMTEAGDIGEQLVE